jgi:hypothetical protein
MFESIKALFIEAPKPTAKLVTITGADNYSELPKGFFNVVTNSGRTSLGYNGTFTSASSSATSAALITCSTFTAQRQGAAGEQEKALQQDAEALS